MDIDMREIEELLWDYCRRLNTEVDEERAAINRIAEPVTPDEMLAMASRKRAFAAQLRYLGRTLKMWENLRDKREAALRVQFAGQWPPSNPLDLFAMWRALLDDINAEGMREYLDGDPFCDSPLFPAWIEVDEALHALDPTDPDSARAILMAAKRDEEEESDGAWTWKDEVLAVAASHAGPDWKP